MIFKVKKRRANMEQLVCNKRRLKSYPKEHLRINFTEAEKKKKYIYILRIEVFEVNFTFRLQDKKNYVI